MERGSLTLIPRQEGWWAEEWIARDTEDVYVLWQLGMVRHHEEGGLEAIAVERRRWGILNTPMYSAAKYEESAALDQNIILYREGRAVAFYQREANVVTNPAYTDAQWGARAFPRPDWAALPTNTNARISETIQLFSYGEDGSLVQIDAYKISPPTRIEHDTYTPHASEP